MSPRPYTRCLNAAIRLLTRRDHSSKELGRKLKQRHFPKDHIQSTLSECQRLNYLNDEKYATIYTEQLHRKGYGLRRIRQILTEKGVAQHLILKALNTNDLENKERHNCRAVLEKKLKTLHPKPKETMSKERLYRFLSGRGFSHAVVREALNEVLSKKFS